MRVFYGCRPGGGSAVVVVLEDAQVTPLTTVLGLASDPPGLWDWGNQSIGAEILALAILQACGVADHIVQAFYREFFEDWISVQDHEAFSCTEADVWGWLSDRPVLKGPISPVTHGGVDQ